MEKQRFESLDVYLSAFLSRSIPPELKNRNGRVVFSFPATDQLYELLKEFNANSAVPVADFVQQVKMLRGRMFSERGNVDASK